jgi:hypothetical protein
MLKNYGYDIWQVAKLVYGIEVAVVNMLARIATDPKLINEIVQNGSLPQSLKPNDQQMDQHLLTAKRLFDKPESKFLAGHKMDSVHAQFRRFLKLKEENADNDKMYLAVVELRNRIEDELASVKFIAIDSAKDMYFSNKHPFGNDVAIAFPCVAYDIEEAAKCFALERSTASAFHSIRSLEACIRAMSRCLGIPDPTHAVGRSWFNSLKAIKTEYERRWPTTASRMSGDGMFFEEAHGLLAAIQNPYRNTTMHLDQKYTGEEARHIFEVVGGFMRKVASRMDENGLPLA